MAKVISVSVSMPQKVRIGEMEWLTAIIKEPGTGPVYIAPEGPVGNKSAVHPEAVYAIGVEAYDYWAERLGINRADWKWGHWGENITFEGLLEKDLKIGDILEVGDQLVMQVSAPRNPCVKLSWRLGQPATLLKTLVESGIMGFYLRVLTPGPVMAGDEVRVRSPYPDNMAIIDIPRLFHDTTASSATVRAALDMPALSDYPKMFLRQRLSQSLDSELAGQNRWVGWRDFVITAPRQESQDVRSFTLEPVDGAPLAGYRAGQFLTFALPGADGRKLIRQWSISDFDVELSSYRISVKRAVVGTGSHWMHDIAKVGTVLPIKAPAGRFVLDVGSTKPIIFISAGIGITPLLAMLKAHAARTGGQMPPVIWIHTARDGISHAFRDEVEAIIATGLDIRKHVYYSRPSSADRIGQDYDVAGRPTISDIKNIAGIVHVNLAGRTIEIPGQICEYYLCGPDEMQQEFHSGLKEWGVEEYSIHAESFSPPQARQADSVEQAVVTFATSGVSATWHRDDGLTLLEFAELHGVTPQHSCRMGSCHSCMCAVSDGRVDHLAVVDGIGPAQALVCCAVPASEHLVLPL